MRMKWIGKLTGGLLGAVALGPIGAALGVLLGHQFDEHGEELQAGAVAGEDVAAIGEGLDWKSTRLNSRHSQKSYAVFCFKKKKNINLPGSARSGSSCTAAY